MLYVISSQLLLSNNRIYASQSTIDQIFLLTGVLRHGQLQWCKEFMLSLDTDLHILKMEAGVCEVLRSR